MPGDEEGNETPEQLRTYFTLNDNLKPVGVRQNIIMVKSLTMIIIMTSMMIMMRMMTSKMIMMRMMTIKMIMMRMMTSKMLSRVNLGVSPCLRWRRMLGASKITSSDDILINHVIR